MKKQTKRIKYGKTEINFKAIGKAIIYLMVLIGLFFFTQGTDSWDFLIKWLLLVILFSILFVNAMGGIKKNGND